MILLDTDQLTVLYFTEHPRCAALTAKLKACEQEQLAISVVSVEEQTRGWLAVIRRHRDVHRQIVAYARLIELIECLKRWKFAPFDVRAADEFKRLQTQRIRVGSQDLKIASIALVHDALLLSANRRDFERVPGLRIENWLN